VPKTNGQPIIFTDRDHDILMSLLKYRYLSAPQLQRLHFPSLQTATRRLRLLSAAGYVTTFRSIGSTDVLATLSKRGAELVAERLTVPFDQLGWDGRRQRPKDYLFLQHFLAASDFRITLTQACAATSDVQLLGFLPEHIDEPNKRGWVRKSNRDVIADVQDPRPKITHTPDGVFALERASRPALFFLEIDRGTETLSNPDRGLLKTIRFYLSSFVSESYQRFQQDFGATIPFKAFRVLIVVTSADRLQNIRKLSGSVAFEPAVAKRLVWLTTDDALHDANILSRRWVSLDPTDTATYAILGAPAAQIEASAAT
jgi:hypothetical protein